MIRVRFFYIFVTKETSLKTESLFHLLLRILTISNRQIDWPSIFLTNERITWKEGWKRILGEWKRVEESFSTLWLLCTAASRAMRARKFKRLCKFRIKMHFIEISDYSAKGEHERRRDALCICVCGLSFHPLIHCLSLHHIGTSFFNFLCNF